MGTKQDPGKFDCWAKALHDEPVFVILGRDPYGPALLRRWAKNREKEINAGTRPETDREAVTEARKTANDMFAWFIANKGTWRAPAWTHHVVLYDHNTGEWHIISRCHSEEEAVREARIAHDETTLTYGARHIETGKFISVVGLPNQLPQAPK